MVFEAMEKLIKEGFPQQAFFNLALKVKKGLFYLGSICLSEGKKVIYFPGTIENNIEGEPTGEYVGKKLHHFSLEKDLKKWHITLEKGEHIKQRLLTREVGEGLFYWFSFSVKNLKSLEEFRKDGNKYQIKRIFTGIPPTHSGERTKFLHEALNAGQTVALTPEALQDKPFYRKNKYFHFSFLIDEQHHKLKKINFVNPPLKCKTTEMSTIHKIRIKRNLDLIIVCAWLNGELSNNVLYHWGQNINYALKTNSSKF